MSAGYICSENLKLGSSVIEIIQDPTSSGQGWISMITVQYESMMYSEGLAGLRVLGHGRDSDSSRKCSLVVQTKRSMKTRNLRDSLRLCPMCIFVGPT